MNVIYYFSGTGNTLFAARKFAEALGNDTQLISISSLNRAEKTDPWNADTVGFFFPVYCFGLPHIFAKFMERVVKWKNHENAHKPYVYALCTSGGMKGTAAMILDNILYEKNLRLDAAFHVQMPSNYIPLSKPPTEERCQRLFKKAEEAIVKFAEKVKNRKKERPIRVFPFDMFGELIAQRAVDCMMENYDKYFWLNEDCNACGICQKVCPASNIIMMNGMPTWRGHCEQCMACLQWCPQQAIQFKQVTKRRKRYHHPDIKVEDMFRNQE